MIIIVYFVFRIDDDAPSAVCPSVCLSRRLTAAATCSWLAAARPRAADIGRLLPPASPSSTAGSVDALIRGGSTQTWLFLVPSRFGDEIGRGRQSTRRRRSVVGQAGRALSRRFTPPSSLPSRQFRLPVADKQLAGTRSLECLTGPLDSSVAASPCVPDNDEADI